MNEDHFNTIYVKFSAMVLRRCRYILKEEETALDAMQEVFTRILSGKRIALISNWGGYLYKTATNICLNLLREKQRLVVNSEILFVLQGQDNVADAFIDKLALTELNKMLDNRNRLITVLRFKHKHRLDEIAEIIGISVSAVKKRLTIIKAAAQVIKEVYHE